MVERTQASHGISDTPDTINAVLIAGYRKMSGAQKLAQVCALNRTIEDLARLRIQAQYGSIPEDELRLRLAALRLGRETMIRVFAWDPDVRGW